MELVTGRAGSPHITAQQDRQLHQGIWGEGAYILNTGNMFEPVVQSSNKILIKDCALMYQGALFSVKVGTADEITIDNGNQGMQRKDLVVARYTYDSAQNIESASWLVYKGTAVGSNPVLPSGISGDIQAGDNVVDVPYLAVTLEGINIVSVDVIPEVVPDIPTINASLAELDDKVGIKIVDILQCDITYGDDFIIEGGGYHTCTGTIKSDKKISDCKFKAFFICSNYGVPMSDPTFLVRGDYNVTVQQPVRNYTDIDHSVITTIGVICYK